MDKNKSEIFEKISESLEERTVSDRRNREVTAEYINPEMDRRKNSRRTESETS